MVARRWAIVMIVLPRVSSEMACLDEVLVFGVDARGRLIEDDNGRVLEDGPRDGRALIALFEKLGLWRRRESGLMWKKQDPAP